MPSLSINVTVDISIVNFHYLIHSSRGKIQINLEWRDWIEMDMEKKGIHHK